MSPKAKPTPHRLGPPPQLGSSKIPVVHQKFTKKVQPKLKEVLSRHIKILAKWFHTTFSWKKFLMSWMVLLIASKMVLLMLTYQFFTLTSLVSLQIFHGVWTIAFFCLTVIDTKTVLPNASCLLAGYLPATTVLHILLIPNDYPLPYIITDAVTTLLAIVTMFLLLRMECSQILQEAEELWQQQPPSAPESDAGTNSTALSSGSPSPQMERHVIPPIAETVSSPQYQVGYPSMDERERREINNNNMGYEEAIDLEPIDFEHFIDEPDLGRNQMEKMFRNVEPHA
jgi:hypothetical protein